ncbi:MAG: D-aminoacylase [Bacteroidetes bacterium]|nr:D-aminoacylase [Bacteroidota bacterium]
MDTHISRRSFLYTLAGTGASALLAGCAPTPLTVRAGLDLVILNGLVLDGTGSPERRLDVGIRDGVIVALGNLADASAARVIDARNLKVVPGFIDIHSHTDLDLLKNPFAPSKVRQGVTTEVPGQDGESPAPLGGPGLDESLKGFREAFGFDCPYRDMDGFLTLLSSRGMALNIASMVGLGTLRGVSVGFDDRPATADEITAMKIAARTAIEQGCWGASTGLEYTPGSFASEAELIEVMRALPDSHRLYATHMRNEADRVLEAIGEAIAIARGSNARLQVSHLKAQNKVNWPKQEIALRMLDDALASGLNVHADRYPYVAFNTGLTNLFPLWSRDGGKEKYLERLKDPTLAERLRTEVQRKVDGLGSWDSVLISSVKNEESKKFQGKTIQQISREESADPYEFTVALQLRENAEVGMVGFGMDEAGTEMVLAWRNTIVASDAGPQDPSDASWPHPRSYGTFPRAIAHYQRERKITTLPDMIRKMTSLPAEVLGLTDRGVIAEGKAADIVLFDYNTIADRAQFTDPHRFPDGIPYVIVNGTVVVDNSVQTSAKPGKVLRS